MIGHGPAAHCSRPGGADPAKCRVLRRIGCQYRHIPRSGIVILIIQPVGVGERGILHSQFRRLVVHGLHKFLQPAAAVRQRQRRVVAAAQHQAVQQFLHRHRLAGLEIHGGALHHMRSGHSNGIGQPGPVQCYQRRHDFGGAGDPHPPSGILFIQDLAAVRVHQNRSRGRKLDRLCPAGQKRQQHCKYKKETAPSPQHDITSDIILCRRGLSLVPQIFGALSRSLSPPSCGR